MIALYLGAIVTANLLITHFGPQFSIVTAFLFIGLDLTTRDSLHERWQGNGLWWKMITLVGSGSLISYLLNYEAGPIALASFVAFAIAGLTDTLTYQLLKNRQRLVKINGSNIVSAATDSLIFPILAFGWPPLWGIIAGQFIAKVGGGLFWSLILNIGKDKK